MNLPIGLHRIFRIIHIKDTKKKEMQPLTPSNKCHCCVAVHDIFYFVARYTDA